MRRPHGRRHSPEPPVDGGVEAIPLVELDPTLESGLKEQIVRVWLRQAGVDRSRHLDALDAIEIEVVSQPPARHLTVTSHFSGSTHWLYNWTGSAEEAHSFASRVGADEADWLIQDRALHGKSEWD